MFTGLSGDYPGTVSAFSWDFLLILFMCFLFSPREGQHINKFEPHPFLGQSRKVVYVIAATLQKCRSEIFLRFSLPKVSWNLAWNFGEIFRASFSRVWVCGGKFHQNFTSKTVWKTENVTQISLCWGAALIYVLLVFHVAWCSSVICVRELRLWWVDIRHSWRVGAKFGGKGCDEAERREGKCFFRQGIIQSVKAPENKSERQIAQKYSLSYRFASFGFRSYAWRTVKL